MRHIIQVFLLLITFSSTQFALAGESEDTHSKEFNPLEMIAHHISDSHYWHIISYTNSEGKHVDISMPLPMILIHEGQFHVFMSSAFDHGQKVVQKGNTHFTLYHDKVYVTNENGDLEFDEEHHPTNAHPLDFSITRNVGSMWLSVILLLWLFITAARCYKGDPKTPRGIQSFLEPLILFVRDDIALSQIDKHKVDKFLPYLLTVFFFIWINDLLGLIPFFPGGSNLTGNISVTMVLALMTFFITNIYANKGYWLHIFWMPGVPVPIRFLLAIIEFIGIFTKPFALMIRLMANITAGHIIILSLFSLIFVMKSVAIAPVSILMGLMMFMLELLVAALQAYIFTLLSALFIGMAVQEDEH